MGLGLGGTSRSLCWKCSVVLCSFIQHPLTEYGLSFGFALLQGRALIRHCLVGQTQNVSERGRQGQMRGEWGKQGPGPRGRSVYLAVLGFRTQLLPCSCPLPPSTPCHFLSSRVCVHLLARGSVPGTRTLLPARLLALGPCPPDWPVWMVMHPAQAHPSEPTADLLPPREFVSPPFAQRSNICHQPQSQQ